MWLGQLLHGFSFKQNLVPNYKISVKKVWQHDSLINHIVFLFASERNPAALQFNHQRILINNFVLATTEFPMNFHAKSNYFENLLFIQELAHAFF